ncbi:MAG: Uncharacterised protein [Prochlorococcus marinus str. MIT 9215]|nr:MAG: Uncharacterised protein [Prochlorococcus marinus str. MIT 9215]
MVLACATSLVSIGFKSGFAQPVSDNQEIDTASRNEEIIETIDIKEFEIEKDFENSGSFVLPKNSAIVCRVLMDVFMDPERRYSLPITLLTTLDVHDVDGEVAIPSNSIVSAIIQKKEQGDLISIERIVYRGLAVPIQVDGRLIPAQIRPEQYGEYIEPPQSKTSSIFENVNNSNLIPTLLGFALADTYNQSNSSSSNIPPLLIGVLGVDIGINLLSALFDKGPQKVPPLVEIQKDTLIVFTLTESLELPDSSAPPSILTEEQ